MKNRITLIAAAVLVALVASIGGATAAGTIGSGDIRDNSIKGKDLKKGLVKKLDNREALASAESEIKGLAAKVDALQKRLDAINRGEVGAPFVANAGSTVTATTITLTGGNTSAESPNLNRAVQAGDVIAFHYELSGGATCNAGAPRVFVETQGVFTNSWDYNIGDGLAAACGGASHNVTFKVPANGRIGQAGFVYDSGNPGTVTITNFTVDGVAVPFA